MFDQGYLTILEVRGVPVRAHWTTPFGALLFSRFQFNPGFWVGFVAILIVHEMGHALLVQRQGLKALSADIHGFGGQCRYTGSPTPYDVSVIAWGGVLAQGLLLAGTYGFVLALGQPEGLFLSGLASAFTYTNLLLIGLNLIPFPPLDGYHAWRIFRYWRRPKRSPRPTPPKAKPTTEDDVSRAKELTRQALDDARRSKTPRA